MDPGTLTFPTMEARRFSVLCRFEQTARTVGHTASFRNLRVAQAGGAASAEPSKEPPARHDRTDQRQAAVGIPRAVCTFESIGLY